MRLVDVKAGWETPSLRASLQKVKDYLEEESFWMAQWDITGSNNMVTLSV